MTGMPLVKIRAKRSDASRPMKIDNASARELNSGSPTNNWCFLCNIGDVLIYHCYALEDFVSFLLLCTITERFWIVSGSTKWTM